MYVCMCMYIYIYTYIPEIGHKMYKILQHIHKHNLCYMFRLVFANFRETINQSNSYDYEESNLKFTHNSKNVVDAIDIEF